MMRFTLPSGRKVEMRGLHIMPTEYRYDAPSSVSHHEHQSNVVAGVVKRLYPDGDIPFTIVWPVREPILQATCVASFMSGPMHLPDDEGFSYLVVCWFVRHIEASVANIVCEGLSRLDWEGSARDVPWW